jgi:hypothetical protein
MSNNLYPAMTFFGALEQIVFKGARITRREWDSPLTYGFLNNGKLMLHFPDGKLHDWIISDGDLTADDWFVLT